MPHTNHPDSERSRFLNAVDTARRDWNSKRRRLAPLLEDDFTAIAACLLDMSFWPFRTSPECVSTTERNDFPCAVEFGERGCLPVPESCTSLWDFVHQLSHWCLPLEGHNADFCSFYVALMDHALGKLACRSLCRAFDDHGVPYSADWLGLPEVRHELLHPFVSSQKPNNVADRRPHPESRILTHYAA